ncbi:hypothetical protein NL676_017479 [Syzygium grande]|nr:hypothetical protein NL676_017479 [Syzygium grande]
MEKIKHSHVAVRDVKLHVAEIGEGPKVVVFLHGFPETWYTWRHQMIGVADAGYRAIAIDFRGYGLSKQPLDPEKGCYADLVEDVVALLDALGIAKSGHSLAKRSTYKEHKPSWWGRTLGLCQHTYWQWSSHTEFVESSHWESPSCYPDPQPSNTISFPKAFTFSDGRLDVKTVIRNIYILFSRSELPVARDDQEIMDLVDASTRYLHGSLRKISRSMHPCMRIPGFGSPYRNIGKEYGMVDPKVTAPALLIMGEKDFFLKFPGMEDYIRSGQVKHFVPNLDIAFTPEGSHFVLEQLPDQVNSLIVDFLNKQNLVMSPLTTAEVGRVES